jgi:hypothetical protein
VATAGRAHSRSGRGGRGVLAAAQVAHSAAGDPQQEQVEHGEEAELEHHGDRIGIAHHSTSKDIS